MSTSDIKYTNVVIVGGGISGLSAAYYLSQYDHLKIQLIEKSQRFGGRIATFQHESFEADFGGKYLLKSNSHILELCNELDINVTKHSGERVIIGDEAETLVPTSDTSFLRKFMLYLKLFITYKSSLIKLYRRLSRDRNRLNRFYQILENEENTSMALDEFNEFFLTDAKSYLIDQGVDAKLIDDFFNPLQRGIYMQDMDNLVGIFVVLLLGAFDYDLLTVEDTNKVLIDRLVENISSNVEYHTSENVDKIIKQGDHYTVNTNNRTIENIDYVYVATTYDAATEIQFEGFIPSFEDYLEMINGINYNSKTYKHFISGVPSKEIQDHLVKNRAIHLNKDDNIFLIDALNSENQEIKYFLVTATAETVDLGQYFSSWKYLANPFNWNAAYPNYTPDNWRKIREVKEFEHSHKGLFSNIMISSNTYITTIETGIIKAKKFKDMVLIKPI